MWGLLINSYVWPFEARRELRRGLSECVPTFECPDSPSTLTSYRFFLNSSYLYERIVRTYSHGGDSPLSTPAEPDNEHTALLSPARSHEDFVAMEIELQLTLIRVRLPVTIHNLWEFDIA